LGEFTENVSPEADDNIYDEDLGELSDNQMIHSIDIDKKRVTKSKGKKNNKNKGKNKGKKKRKTRRKKRV
jgi:hypothetical protein